MGILDIVIIVIALIFALVGTFKGFVKGFLGALGGIIALVAAYFLSDLVSGWISGSSLGVKTIESISSWFISKNPQFGEIVPAFTNEYLSECLSNLGIPEFLHGLIIGAIDVSTVTNQSVAGFLAPKIAGIAFTGISYIIIFLVVRLVVFILEKVFSKAVHMTALGVVDRILGCIWGIVKAGIIVSVIFLALSFIVTLPFGEGINNWMAADFEKGFGLAEMLYTKNPLIWLYEKVIAKI